MNLLYPNGKENCIEISDDIYQNLAIEEIVNMITSNVDNQTLLRKVFKLLPQDKETILFRQEIIKDFIENEEICDKLGAILKKLDVLKEYKVHNHYLNNKKSGLWDLIDYVSEMDVYVQVVEELTALFDECDINSKGLTEISGLLKETIEMDRIAELKEIVASLHTDISTLKCVTLQVNLTPELRPEEIQIAGYSPLPFKSKFKDRTAKGLSILAQREIKYNEAVTPLMAGMVRDMEKDLVRASKKHKEELNKYINFKV